MGRVEEILGEIGRLSLREQRKLRASGRAAKRGIPASEFLGLAGSISREDMEAIEKAVDEDCEHIDPEGW